ncbi:MAG: PDZ domain-containing protein [Deltaproteobacteria bacterium]|nr:PDZ domain-containing protein [Deltaproteobacteria bacterium]
MRPVSALVEEFREVLPDRTERVRQWLTVFLPRLRVFLALGLLALGAGWVGGWWAIQSAVPRESRPLQTVGPESLSLAKSGLTSPTTSEVMKPGALPEEVSPTSPAASVDPAAIHSVKKVYLGIRGKTFHQGEVQGVKITAVFPGSPAEKAGLRSDRDPAPAAARRSSASTGHIIVGADGKAIRSEEDMSRLLALSVPGSIVKFLVTSIDEGSYQIVPVVLGAVPGTGTAPTVSPAAQASAEEVVRNPAARPEASAGEIEEEVFRAVNQARAEKSLPPLQENPQLQQAARRHSEDMATRHFFGHLNPDGQDVVDRLRAQGIKDFTAAGENIFNAKTVTDPAQVAVREWLNSPKHRRNLLNPRYTAGGVGISQGETGTIYVTQVYLER